MGKNKYLLFGTFYLPNLHCLTHWLIQLLPPSYCDMQQKHLHSHCRFWQAVHCIKQNLQLSLHLVLVEEVFIKLTNYLFRPSAGKLFGFVTDSTLASGLPWPNVASRRLWADTQEATWGPNKYCRHSPQAWNFSPPVRLILCPPESHPCLIQSES